METLERHFEDDPDTYENLLSKFLLRSERNMMTEKLDAVFQTSQTRIIFIMSSTMATSSRVSSTEGG